MSGLMQMLLGRPMGPATYEIASLVIAGGGGGGYS